MEEYEWFQHLRSGKSLNFVSAIQQCSRLRDLRETIEVHKLLTEAGLERNIMLGNLLIQTYGRCGDVDACRSVFDKLQFPNVYSWTIMLEAYAENGYLLEAEELFKIMPQRNVVSWTSMVNAYGQYRHVDLSWDFFERMPERNIMSWNAMLAAFAANEKGAEALRLFRDMNLEGLRSNSITFIIILKVGAQAGEISRVKMLHALIAKAGFEGETKLGNSLIKAYGACFCPVDAREVFDKMPEKNNVSWNCMLAAYSKTGEFEMASNLFHQMLHHDLVSWNTMISAQHHSQGSSRRALQLFQLMCLSGTKPDKITFIHLFECFSSSKDLCSCRALHKLLTQAGYEKNSIVGTALVKCYGECGSLSDARRALGEISDLDVVAWTTMITVLVDHKLGEEALNLLRLMDLQGTTPNEITLLSALHACSITGSSYVEGKAIESATLETGLDKVEVLRNALIDMHGSCGSITDAWKYFEISMRRNSRNTASWNSMLGALLQNGEKNEATVLFKKMNLEGVKPDAITFISVLAFCRVAEGKKLHELFLIGTGLELQLRVQNALLSMYAEGGCLEKARDVFESIENPSIVSWSAMIGAYAGCGRNSEALRMFQMMNQRGELPDDVTFITIISSCAHAGLLEDGCQYFVWMQQDHFITPTPDHFMCLADLLGRTSKLPEAEDVLNGMPFEPGIVAWTSLLACCKTVGDSERAERISRMVFEMEASSSGPYALLSSVRS